MCCFNQTIFKNIILLSICLFGIFDSGPGFCLQAREIGVVKVNALNMRTEPGEDRPILKVLEKGAQVRILDRQNGWLRVSHEGDVGYVSGKPQYLELYTIHSVTGREKDGDVETTKTRIRDIEQQIQVHQSELVSYTRQEKKVIEKLLETDSALNRAKQKAKDIRAELDVANHEISKIQASVESIQKTIQQNRGYAVNRAVSLYKLNMLGGMNLFASATSLTDLLRQRAALERILAYDYQVIEDMARNAQQLTDTLDQLNKKIAEKVQLDKKYQDGIRLLAEEKAKRERILADIKTEKSNRMAAIKYLKKAAAELDRTLASLGQGSLPKNAKAFFEFKGLLKIPVEGKIIGKYGSYMDPISGTADFRKGIEIQAERGAPIRSVFEGQTIYADWLKGYGNVIIIAHGNSYHTVYAHAEDLFKSKGDSVETGEVIATVGDSGAMGGPSLYFEIRHQGSPVNPSDWLDDRI